MSEDLRDKIAAAIANPGNPAAAVTAELYDEEVDAALAVFAAWLRERADAVFADDPAVRALSEAADEIAPKEQP